MIALAASLFVVGAAPPVDALVAPILVTSNQDVVATNGQCSLREAILEVTTPNSVPDCALPAGSTPTTYISLSAAGPYVLGGTPLFINASMTIDGGDNIIDAGDQSRVISIASGMVALNRLHITGGKTVGDPGGGIFVGPTATVTVSDSTVVGNRTDPAGFVVISQPPGGGLYNAGTVTLLRSVVSANDARSGGGVYNDGSITITESTVAGNVADEGGGIANDSGATLTLTRSTVADNSASPGPIHGDRGDGAGVLNRGTATVTDSTISDNVAHVLVVLLGTGGDGGGGFWNSGALTISNSTISGNESIRLGGGIFTTDAGTVDIRYSTVTANIAIAGSGLYSDSSSAADSTTVGSSIIGDNIDGASMVGADIDAPTGVINSLGLNLIGEGDVGDFTGPVDLFPLDMGLYPLADYGGPTLTHALKADSSAVDHAVVTIGSDPANDQRGIARSAGLFPDTGAFERSCEGPAFVYDETQLNDAIACYNTDGTPTLVSFGADITLTSPTTDVLDPVGAAAIAIDGQGYTLDGADQYRGFTFRGTTAMVSNLAIVNGRDTSTECQTVSCGAGIAQFGGDLELFQVTLDGGDAYRGGGISNFDGLLTIRSSTVSNNTSTIGAGVFSSTALGTTVLQSTLSGNVATSNGGGAFNRLDGVLSVESSTVTANAAAQGAGIASTGGGSTSTTVTRSIVAGNTGSAGGDVDVVIPSSPGTFVSGGANVIGTGNAAGTFNATQDINTVSDPQVGPLANNGGLTLTHRPFAGSPALDRFIGGSLLVFDQRGEPRYSGLGLDSGSVEARLCVGFVVTVNLGVGQTPTAGDDVIVGTEGPDSIVAGAGNDVVCGFGGDDVIGGNAGNDIVWGGDGDDTLFGGDGNDTLQGDDGVDVILGGLGEDSIDGGAGNDQLSGNEDNDTIDGGAGEDQIFGGFGADLIDAGADADTILGGLGNDAIVGGEGADLISGNGGADDIQGGGGGDTLYGVDGDDTIDGGADADAILGGPGNDTVLGQSGNDQLSGNSGDDDIDGGSGSDNIYGVDGDDTLNGGMGSDTILGGLGMDTIDGGDGDDLLSGNEDDDNIQGGLGVDTIYGAAGNDILAGGDGNDTILGGSGNDDIHGDDGNDLLSGNAGDDYLESGEGMDTLYGGTGDDFLESDNLDATGNDTLNGQQGTSDVCTAQSGDIRLNCEFEGL